jgi:hypothetical protein
VISYNTLATVLDSIVPNSTPIVVALGNQTVSESLRLFLSQLLVDHATFDLREKVRFHYSESVFSFLKAR